MSQPGRDPNPYTPPSAELGGGRVEDDGSRRIGWKIFAFALLGLSVASLFLYEPGWLQSADVLDLALSCVSLAGVFGYAFRRAFGARGFWAVWLPFQIVWDALFNFLLTPAGLAGSVPGEDPMGTLETVFVYLFVYTLICVPLYIALYRYAHRSSGLWASR